MLKSAVLLDLKTLGDDIDLSTLRELFDCWQDYELCDPTQIIARCQHADVIITNKVVLSRETLIKLPKLKLIAVTATGTNNIDIDGAKELGIGVINVEGYGARSVAQHTFSLLLQLTNRTTPYQKFMREGGWQQSEFFSHLDFPMLELAGKNFGILGFGASGQLSAKLAQAFGMKLLISERPGAVDIRDERVSFEQMLAHSDVVSLHCPLTSDTVQVINQQTLKLMKPSALLINTARGGLINDADLVSALSNNIIAGAALDVLTTEPPTQGNCLLDYQGDNLVVTPHIAWATVDARRRLVTMLGQNISHFFEQ